MKDGYCEFCADNGDCCVCDDIMRLEDDGGLVIDHDADTTPADTLPEVAALTRTDLKPVTVTWREQSVLVTAFMVWLAWVGVVIWFFSTH